MTTRLTVEITYYGEAELREMVIKGKVRFEEELDEDAKVRILQQRVWLNAIYRYEIEVADGLAARRVEIGDLGDEL